MAIAAQAHADLVTAYGEIAGETSTTTLTGTDLGGLTLTPGVYSFATSASLAAATTLTLNAEGNPNARFDFQIGTTLITGSGAAISLINGAEADNVYFQVGSSATLGTGTAFQGNILADQSVTLTTGATMMDGRASGARWCGDDGYQHGLRPNGGLGRRHGDEDDAAGPVLAGTDITYTITVLNTGPSDAQTVALTDPLPADTTFVSDTQTLGLPFTLTGPAVGGTGTISDTIATLPLGDSATFTVVLLVSPSTPSLTTITNTATVTSTTSTNSASASNAITQSADVTVTKTSAAGPVLAGNDITYTITVLNTGPSNAQTVALTDPLPADTTFVSDTQTAGLPFTLTGPAVGGTGTISDTIATLPFGDSATFTVVLQVSPSTPNLTTITNTATVTSTTSTNSASAANTITQSADVTVTKTSAARHRTRGQ